MDQAPLYNSIDFHEPWNSISNDVNFQPVIETYLIPGNNTRMVGSYGAAHYAGNDQFFNKNSTMRMRDITDGTSNTIMAGEVSENFKAWGDPENLRDLGAGVNNGMNGLGSPFTGGANVLMGDGSVRFISENIDNSLLKSLMTPDGGEEIDTNY